MATSPPQLIDRYVIHNVLGTGGMGTVYRAWDPLLERFVAVKVLDGSIGLDTARLNLLLDEARLAARLEHDNIIRIYDVSRGGPPFFIVSELAEGNVLSEWLASRQPLSTELAGHVVRRLASALDHAHQRNIIHRDIKPANIMLHPDGRVKLLDFGVALFVGTQDLKQRGGIVGTPSYMSPEQIQRRPLTPATDIYNLGLVAYEMLTGRTAFTGANDYQILEKQVGQLPESPLALNKTLATDVAPVLLKALDKDPSRRPVGAGAFAKELSTALKSNTMQLGPRTPSGRLDPPLPLPRTRPGLGAVTAAMGVALAIALLLGVIAVSMIMNNEAAVDIGDRPGTIAMSSAETGGAATSVTAVPLAATIAPVDSVAAAASPTTPTLAEVPISLPTTPASVLTPAPEPSLPPAAVATDRCQAGLKPPRLDAPEANADCSGGCTFQWLWDLALQADEYFQIQFRPAGTNVERGLHSPTRANAASLGGDMDQVFRDVCGSDCSGTWSVAVVRWDGQNPNALGCVVARSEWRPGKL